VFKKRLKKKKIEALEGANLMDSQLQSRWLERNGTMYSTPIHLYNRALELRKKGLGPRRIAREIGVNEGTIANWFYRGHKPVIRGVLNLSPCPELSYLLGVRYSDGCVSGGFRLWVKDRDFSEKSARCLSKVMGKHYRIYKNKKGYWVAQAFGKSLVNFMCEPWDHHKSIIEAYPADFLEAFFDGEGNVAERRGGKHQQYTYGHVGVTNTNLEILEYIRNLLQERFLIHSNIYKVKKSRISKKDCYVLRIYRTSNIRQFYKMIGFSIARKKKRLEKILREMKSNHYWKIVVAGSERTCPTCGSKFQTHTLKKKFCSARCRQADYRNRHESQNR